MIIGITGPFGSGKSTASSHLASKGYTIITLSSFLEEEAHKRGIKRITRKILQDIGNEWREKRGKGILVKKALTFIKKEKLNKIVIDGVRNIGEIDALRRTQGFKLIAVIADREVRFMRLKKLKRRESLTPPLFYKLDVRDMGIGEKMTGLQVAYCIALADYYIPNNETKQQFIEKLDTICRIYEKL